MKNDVRDIRFEEGSGWAFCRDYMDMPVQHRRAYWIGRQIRLHSCTTEWLLESLRYEEEALIVQEALNDLLRIRAHLRRAAAQTWRKM